MEDDSQGKHRTKGLRSRSALTTLSLFVGICFGIMLSEKLYLSNQLNSPGATFLPRRVALTGTSRPASDLEKLLRRVAPEGEVMVAISNMNLVRSRALTQWITCLQRLPLKNWLVVTIDEELRDYCKEKGVNYYYRPVVIPETQANGGDNHAISAMKFEILEEFLQLGWNVLLSDVDIITVQNPFDHLIRDSDVEGMTDGFDNMTAYGEIFGIDDPKMGWSRYAQGHKHMALNSGLFWLKANERTMSLMHRIAARVRTEKAWDQSVYNEEIFNLAHGTYTSPQVSVRVMDYMTFLNSKTLFTRVRKLPVGQAPLPVMVHVNYHPDKVERMAAVYKYYIEGDAKALEPFPDGSE